MAGVERYRSGQAPDEIDAARRILSALRTMLETFAADEVA
jgi:hypothetical protein